MVGTALVHRSLVVAVSCSIGACTIPLPDDPEETGAASSGSLEEGSSEAGGTGPVTPPGTAGEGEAESSSDISFTSTGGSTGEPPGTDDGTSSEPGTEESGDAGEPPLECTALARECAGFANSDLVLFELDTGVVLETLPVPFGPSPWSSSIAWVGDGVYVCSGLAETLLRVDVQTGVTVDSGLPCSGVAEIDGELLVRQAMPFAQGEYARYADFAAAMANTPSDVTSYSPSVHRFTIAGDTLVSAWHSTHELEVYDLATGALVGLPTLEAYDHWIMGMDELDGQIVINTWFDDPMRQIAFDLATGARTCELPSVGAPLDFLEGLACRASEPEPPPPPPPS